MPDGTEWTPGYEDYDEAIVTLSAKGGPKRMYLSRWSAIITLMMDPC